MSSSSSQRKSLVVALVGDSDIARWPQDLLPGANSADDGNSRPNSSSSTLLDICVHVKGENGATLCETLPLVSSILDKLETSAAEGESFLIVVCAGENDISQGTRLDETLISFRRLLEKIFPADVTHNSAKKQKKHLVILGPKFEPWLEYDLAVRKDYVKMSRAMQRACQKFNHQMTSRNTDDVDDCQVYFVDCLVMFCAESGKQPGALLGGRAIPEKKLFDYDQLHLSREGYAIWKDVIDKYISSHFDSR